MAAVFSGQLRLGAASRLEREGFPFPLEEWVDTQTYELSFWFL